MGAKMKIKHCMYCGVELNPDGSYQAHRRMYCRESHKWSMAKLIRRRKARGEPLPWEDPNWKPGTDLRKYSHAEDTPQKARPRPPKPTTWVVCSECHTPYEVPDDKRVKNRMYCSDKCEVDARRRKQLAAYYEKKRKEQCTRVESYAMPYDPWATGQLPAKVRRNALWA